MIIWRFGKKQISFENALTILINNTPHNHDNLNFPITNKSEKEILESQKYKNSFYFSEIKKNFSCYQENFLNICKNKFINNPSLKKSEIISTIFRQNGINFSIEFLKVNNFSKRPINIPSNPNDSILKGSTVHLLKF